MIVRIYRLKWSIVRENSQRQVIFNLLKHIPCQGYQNTKPLVFNRMFLRIKVVTTLTPFWCGEPSHGNSAPFFFDTAARHAAVTRASSKSLFSQSIACGEKSHHRRIHAHLRKPSRPNRIESKRQSRYWGRLYRGRRDQCWWREVSRREI
jgi:hypothetical protein